MTDQRQQDGLHVINKNIRYHGKGAHAEKIVKPSQKVKLTFGHLDEAGYKALIKTRTIVPVKK